MPRANPVYEKRLIELADDFEVKIRKLLNRAYEIGFDARVVSGYRNPYEQQKLYDSGVTAAPAGFSWHNYRLAADIGLFTFDDKYISTNDEGFKLLGPYAEKIALVWGGRWRNPDMPHFQQSGIPMTPTEAYRKTLKL